MDWGVILEWFLLLFVVGIFGIEACLDEQGVEDFFQAHEITSLWSIGCLRFRSFCGDYTAMLP